MFKWLKLIFRSNNDVVEEKELVCEKTEDEIFLERMKDKQHTELDLFVANLMGVDFIRQIPDSKPLEMAAMDVAILQVLSGMEMADRGDKTGEVIRCFREYCTQNLSTSVLIQQLEDLFMDFNFAWGDFDKCCEMCHRLALYPYRYRFLQNAPKPPRNIQETVRLLTVSQMKSILKRHGFVDLPRIKEGVTEIFVRNISIEQCETEINDRLDLLTEKFKYKTKNEKIHILIDTVLARKQALMLHMLCSVTSPGFIKSKIEHPEFIRFNQYDDPVFLSKIFEPEELIDENGSLIILPPYYPGDYSQIRYFENEL